MWPATRDAAAVASEKARGDVDRKSRAAQANGEAVSAVRASRWFTTSGVVVSDEPYRQLRGRTILDAALPV